MRPGGTASPHVEIMKHLVRKAGFSKEVEKLIALDLRGSTTALYRGKWSRFLHWCCGRNLSPCKATVLQMVEFFFYLQRKRNLSVPAAKGYHAVLNHVFSLAGLDHVANCIISRMFHSFKKHAHRERLSHQNETWLVFQSLIHPPYEPP